MTTYFLNWFCQLQVLMAVAGALGLALRGLGRSRRLNVASRVEIRIHQGLFLLLGVFLCFPRGAGREEFRFSPVARVLEAGAYSARFPLAPARQPLFSAGQSPQRWTTLPLGVCAALAAALLLLGAVLVLRDYLRLRRALGQAITVRKIGRVRVAVLEQGGAPFSALGWRGAWVVLPLGLFLRRREARLAIAHELQHHRSRDTLWCHLLAPLRALCFFHPLRVLWLAAFAEAQEFACDESLVNQRKISAREYSECLVHAAQLAGQEGAGRAYAAAPALFSGRRLLVRRIENMFAKKIDAKKTNKGAAFAVAITLGTCLAASAWASGRWVVDARVSQARMEQLAEVARKSTDFPIDVNEEVLAELNQFLGTVKGREFISKATDNLARLRASIEPQREEYHVPEELLAVGLVESGYENLPESANPSAHGAGIWQFIPSTARNFGLRVNGQLDERLNVERETDAAFRYLSANQLRFRDWRLALMAYNMGEQAVDAAITKTGTRDPWALVRQHHENDKRYLAKVMAAVLILKNPSAMK